MWKAYDSTSVNAPNEKCVPDVTGDELPKGRRICCQVERLARANDQLCSDGPHIAQMGQQARPVRGAAGAVALRQKSLRRARSGASVETVAAELQLRRSFTTAGRRQAKTLSSLPMNRRVAWAGVAASTACILVATLYASGTDLPPGWSFDLSSGDSAVAELVQNLLLFIPLGACLTLSGVRRRWTVLIGAALSFSVEFAQQWIPGRDPSTGDIISNTVSTALGMALVITAPRWLHTPPQRSARQALGTAIAAVLVWLITGLVLRPIYPPPPYRDFWTPDYTYWGHYRGKVLSARLDGVPLSQTAIDSGSDPGRKPGEPGSRPGADYLLRSGQPLEVTVIAQNRPPGQASPLVALHDHHTRVLLLSVDGTDVTVNYHMKANELKLEHLDLRWRNALAQVAPKDTFTVQTWRGERGTCFAVNHERRCGLGFTIGDGWKLIFYPEHFPVWLDSFINMLWIAGWTVGVSYWGGRAGKTGLSYAAVLVVVVGLLVVPLVTGLKTTLMVEWIGLVIGLTAPLVARVVAQLPRRQSGSKLPAASF